jgi:hypothetical protein
MLGRLRVETSSKPEKSGRSRISVCWLIVTWNYWKEKVCVERTVVAFCRRPLTPMTSSRTTDIVNGVLVSPATQTKPELRVVVPRGSRARSDARNTSSRRDSRTGSGNDIPSARKMNQPAPRVSFFQNQASSIVSWVGRWGGAVG